MADCLKTTTKVKLLSHDIDVIFEAVPDWHDCGMGRANIMQQRILINNQMPHDITAATVIHELCHIISDILGLELTEAQVEGASVGFYSLIKENPEFIEKLINKKDAE